MPIQFLQCTAIEEEEAATSFSSSLDWFTSPFVVVAVVVAGSGIISSVDNPVISMYNPL